MRSQVAPSFYFRKEYDNKWNFISYWHQINEIVSLQPESILEIGIGNSFVANYLKHRGYNITTFDIDKGLSPDYVGSVLNVPFSNESFEVVACYEVLEHIPYEDFNKALSEVFRISKLYVILSIPDISRVYRFNVQIPKIGEIKKLIPLPRIRKPIHKFDGQHYWEIGKASYPLRRIICDIEKAGFEIKKNYRVFEVPYHHFFILKK